MTSEMAKVNVSELSGAALDYAVAICDGYSATICMNDGDTHNTPVEMMEVRFPILIERHALIPDSGGAGRQRGGLGVEYAVRARTPLNVNMQIERMHCRPWGLEGGLPGMGNRVELERDGKRVDDLPNAKVLAARLQRGDMFLVRSGGGGGFGNPRERPRERVLEDVRQGYVSAESPHVITAFPLKRTNTCS